MNPHKDSMAVLGQLVKLIPRKIIETLRKKHKIQILIRNIFLVTG